MPAAVCAAGHWFTQPMSRLVVNPTMEAPSTPGLPGLAMPVDAAYYAGENPTRLPWLWGVAGVGAGGLQALVAGNATSTWRPSRLQEAASAGGGMLEAGLVFDGPDGLIQRLRVSGMHTPVALCGLMPDGATATWYPECSAVAWQTDDFGFALAVRGGTWEPSGNPRIWAIRVRDARDVAISARFQAWPKTGGAPQDALKALAEAASKRADVASFEAAAAAERNAWAERMARIPLPSDFTLRILPALGASPELIRRRYEEAWAFMLSDTLPPMPENDYPYPQLACGKPSLWGEGHPKARTSAQWESILGMPYLAAVEPDTAWSTFEGMMSLVDEKGTMGGEGLPSRHAETAWLLYSRTRDLHRLRRTYPAIKRLLLWKARDPRWIHVGETAENTKDSEFVSSAMMDMGFAAKIARALDMPQEAAFWTREQAELAADLRRWFWTAPGGDPYEWYDATTGRRWGKDSAWTLETLALPLPLLGAEQRDSLLRLFRRERDDTKPFLVPNLTKQPNLSLTRIGLSLHGKPGEAEAVSESQMRDITLADDFAETYNQQRPLHGTGVRPSLFGALNIIDGVLFHNHMALAGRDD